MAFQNTLLRHIHVALGLRHPWRRTVLESHSPPVRTPCKGSLVSLRPLLNRDGLPRFSLAYYRRPPFDNRRRVGAGGQVAVVHAAVVLQARGAEGVGDVFVAKAQQQRTLHGQGHAVDEIAGAVLEVADVGEVVLQLGQVLVEAAVGAFGFGGFFEEGVECFGFFLEGAEGVQALDVAAAFPDGVNRGFPEQAGHDAVFHHAAAADAFHGFVGVVGGAFADPVFAHGGGQAGQQAFVLVALVVHGPGYAHGVGEGGFVFDDQVGQYVLHQRLVAQAGAEGAAVVAVVAGLGDGLAHAGGAADHAVEAGHGDHFDDGSDAAAFFAHHPRQGAADFHFAGGVGDVAHFVFQLLYLPGVLGAVRAPPGHQEAGQPAGGLGQDQEGVAHGGRDKPFVADQFVGLARAFLACRVGHGGVGAYVAAALFFGHGHADGDGGFFAVRYVAAVVFVGEDFRGPELGQVRLVLDRRDGRESHGDRAAVRRFYLGVQVVFGGAGDLGTLAGVGPG